MRRRGCGGAVEDDDVVRLSMAGRYLLRTSVVIVEICCGTGHPPFATLRRSLPCSWLQE